MPSIDSIDDVDLDINAGAFQQEPGTSGQFVQTYGSATGASSDVKFDNVVIVGPGIPADEIKRIQSAALEMAAEKRTIIIGDGINPITQTSLQAGLTDGLDSSTNIIVLGHGKVKKNGILRRITGHDKYNAHEIMTHPGQGTQTTTSLLSDLKDIFDEDHGNINTRMSVNLFSCHGGATKAPDGVVLVAHSGSKYPTLASMNADAIVESVKNSRNPADEFMHSLANSPQTIIFKEQGKSFKTIAPKKPLTEAPLDRYLRKQLSNFLKFRRDELDHEGIGDNKTIAQTVKDFPIGSATLSRYNELDLMMECRRSKGKDLARSVQTHINNGVSVNAELESGDTPLSFALLNNDERAIGLLLAKDGIDVNIARKSDGATPLLFSAFCGRVGVVKALIEKGADVNRARNDGVTPLFVAVEKGYLLTTRALIEAGADPNLARNDGVTPLSLARESGNEDVIKLLEQAALKKQAETPLLQASAAQSSYQQMPASFSGTSFSAEDTKQLNDIKKTIAESRNSAKRKDPEADRCKSRAAKSKPELGK